jgi:hypothetical protein
LPRVAGWLIFERLALMSSKSSRTDHLLYISFDKVGLVTPNSLKLD